MAMQVILIMKQEEEEEEEIHPALWMHRGPMRVVPYGSRTPYVVPCARIDACILIEEDLIIWSDFKRRFASTAHSASSVLT